MTWVSDAPRRAAAPRRPAPPRAAPRMLLQAQSKHASVTLGTVCGTSSSVLALSRLSGMPTHRAASEATDIAHNKSLRPTRTKSPSPTHRQALQPACEQVQTCPVRAVPTAASSLAGAWHGEEHERPGNHTYAVGAIEPRGFSAPAASSQAGVALLFARRPRPSAEVEGCHVIVQHRAT